MALRTVITLTLLLMLVSAGPAGAASALPTDLEQYLLELINRARADPAAEAARYGIDLNEGLPAGTISPTPKQPLTFDLFCIDAAQSYAQYLLDHDEFSHTALGTFDGRMTGAGYTGTPVGENIALGTLLPMPDLTARVADLHENLFVDSAIAGRGHRVNLMREVLKEAGLGVRVASGYDPPPPGGGTYDTMMMVQDFGTRAEAFLTGVVYDDLDLDGFYTPGEGRGGISVTAIQVPGGATFTTTTWPSGGYSLQLPAGAYTVEGSGGGLGGVITVPGVAVGSETVKVDLDPAQAVLPCLVPTCGDCNEDGQRTIVDALYAAQHAASLIALTGPAFTNCNVQGVAEPDPAAAVSIIDALTIAQFVTGLPTPMICC